MAFLAILNAFLLALLALASADCGPGDSSCEFWLVVDFKLTMTYKWSKLLTVPHNGKLYAWNDTERSHPVQPDDVVTGDGYLDNRLVYVINGTSPGPEIAVYENQEVVIHVQNNLKGETLSIHWHGIHQRGTPWMDGVEFVTQWPILPGSSYTYRFKADPPGTHWYHSHSPLQRTMGIYGAFIVKRRKEAFHADLEHTLLLTDYNHDSTTKEDYAKWIYGFYKNGVPYHGPAGSDGISYGQFETHTGLINGRGRYVDPKSGKNNGAPLSRFETRKGATLRLRLINAASNYPFRFAIESHGFKVISSDGADLDPVKVDALLIYSGETYDVLVNTTDTVKNYKISAKMVLQKVNIYAEAILHYSGAPDITNMPDGDILKCSDSNKPCAFFNCPQRDMSSFQPNVSCVFIDQAKSLQKPKESEEEADTKTFFLNFGFPKFPNGYNGGTVNSRFNILPKSPPLLTGSIQNNCSACVPEDTTICQCSHAVEVKKNTVVRMVLMNVGQGKGTIHPIHLHGHYFRVLKLGFGDHNSRGKLVNQSKDIDCQSELPPYETFCHNATWSNETWIQNLPGANSQGVSKDTVLVPSGGYTVVELVADNPGYWAMHCHQELHIEDGIALLFVSGKEDVGPIPPEVPFMATYGNVRHPNDDLVPGEYFRRAVGTLSGAVGLLLLVILATWCRSQKKKARRHREDYSSLLMRH